MYFHIHFFSCFTRELSKLTLHRYIINHFIQKIINILEEYVKPAVAADGGNIVFDSYDDQTDTVKVMMQGACNGCPSSTFTLKSGIENMLKSMLNNDNIKVEAV